MESTRDETIYLQTEDLSKEGLIAICKVLGEEKKKATVAFTSNARIMRIGLNISIIRIHIKERFQEDIE